MADRIFPYGEAPDDAEFVVTEPNSNLPNAKELVAGTGISVTVGPDTVTISGDGSSAQTYITANDETATLPNSFQVVEGSNVTLDYVGNQLIISAQVSGAGGGTVTIVNSGNANPLFTTNVTTASTTPTIAYTLSAASSGTFFRGPASGVASAGAYGGILGTDLTGALSAGQYITLTPAVAPGSRLTINATGLQPLSSTLNALSTGLSGTGYIAQIGPDSFAERTFQDSTNITWTNPAGIAGNSSANVTSNVYTKDGYSLLNHLASTVPSQGQVPMGASDGSYILTKPNAGTGIQMDFSNGVFTVSATGATGNPGTVTTFSAGQANPIFGTSVSNPTSAPTLSFNITSPVLQDLATGSGTGIVVSTDGVHHAYRSVQGTTGEINVTNPAGTAGNITLSLDSSVYTDRDSSVLNALATGLTGTGFVSQNGAQFYDRTLTGTANRVTVTNGTGASGDPVFDVGQDVLVVGDVTALPGIQIVNGTGVIQIGASGALGGTLTNITVGDIDPLWTTNVSNPTTTPTVSFVLNDMPSGAVLIGPQTGADAPGTLRRLLGDDLLSAIEAGSNITFSAVGDRIVISSTASGGGGGTVTEVFSGDLPPLFTTTVNNSTTVPDIQYILNSTASGNFLAGPASGSNGTWTSRGILGTDLTGALQAGTNITISQSTPPNSRLIVALAGQIDASLIADGSVSNTEFQYLNGVTSGIQGQLDNKQPLDSTLTALAAFNSNGIMTQTAADTFTSRTVTGTAGNITITNGDGVSGNPTVNVGSNVYTRSDSSVLNALATGVNGTGFLAQNGASFADRTLTGTTNRITVTNGTGAAGNPVFDLGSDVLTISTSNVLNDLATSTSTGVVVQTDSVGHHAYRTLTGTANEVTVTNGDGVSGNPTFSLPTGIDVTKLANGSVDNTEFQYLDGVTSSIQTQLDGKLVSAGDLAPLFTTAEAAGNISFTLSNVASGTFLAGPASGGNGPWVNRGILGTDLTGAVQAGSNVTITQAPEPGSRLIISSTGSSGYNTIQEEGSDLTQRSTIDFVGAGITASDTGSKTQVTLDATLNSLAAYNTNGLVTQTGADTFTGRTITGTGNRISVSNGNGVSGNPTIDVGTDVLTISTSNVLNDLATSTSTGVVVQTTSAGAHAYRTITGTTNEITVSNGNGVSGNPTIGLSTGIDATKIANGSVTSTEFQYLSNVTSDIQTQFSNKQPLDATLTSLAAFNTNGLMTQTAADTFTGRTVTGTGNRISVTNGNGVSGNPTIDVGTDVLTISTSNVLNNLATSTGTGIMVQTSAAGAQARRTITGTGTNITVSNGDGISGNPTIDVGANVYTRSQSSNLNYLASATVAQGQVPMGQSDGSLTYVKPNAGSGIQLSFSNGVFTIASSGAGAGITQAYQTIQEEGSNLTQRSTLNFVGGGITAADNSGQSRTDVTLDATLNSLASYNTNGILTQTAADTFTGRTITGTGSNITVTDGNGVSGNPTLDVGSNVYTRSQSSVLNYLASASPAQGQIPMGRSDGSYLLTKPNAGAGVELSFSNGVFTVAASGAAAMPLAAIKTTNQSVANSAAPADDNQLVIPLTANKTTKFVGTLFIGGNTTGDFRMIMDAPTGATITYSVSGGNLESGQNVTGSTNGSGGTSTVISIVNNGTLQIILFNGSVINGSTAGNLKLRWAQGTTNGTATIVYAGSHMQTIA